MGRLAKFFVIPIAVAIVIGITLALMQKESSIFEPELTVKEFEFTAVHLESEQGDHEMHAMHTFVVVGDQNSAIEVNVGDFVRLKVKNTDMMMKHDFALPALDLTTGILEPGEYGEIEFRAMMVGELEYICTLHPDQMNGLIVINR